MLSSPYLGWYIFLGIFLAVAALVVWLVRWNKRHQAQRKQMFLEYGFQDVPERAAELAERAKDLHHHWSEHHGVEELKRKSEWGYELILFDLKDSSGDSVHREQDQALLISPDLKLPRFTLFPKAEGAGFLAAMANRVLAWISARFAAQVAFPDHPSFDAKYLVWGNDESAVRALLTPARLDRLAETRELQVEGNADGFLFSRMEYRRVKRTDAEKLQDLLRTAKVLFEIFKE